MHSPHRPRSWRLVKLNLRTLQPCPQCGEPHHYLMRTMFGACLPMIFPPGVSAAATHGSEVEAMVVGTVDHTHPREEQSAYEQVAARVKATTIRCEGCGERFDDLERYRLHACEVRYW